jgi:hypothetical protein
VFAAMSMRNGPSPVELPKLEHIPFNSGQFNSVQFKRVLTKPALLCLRPQLATPAAM